MNKTTQESFTDIAISRKKPKSGCLLPLLFGSVSEEDRCLYKNETLIKAADMAFEVLIGQKAGKPNISIENAALEREGVPLSVLTIVNDNKPFLLDSVMNVINEARVPIYLVVHPVFDLQEEGKERLVLTAEAPTSSAPKGKRRISVMQIHMQLLSKAQTKDLKKALSDVLMQVAAAVEDWPEILKRVEGLAKKYEKKVPAKYREKAAQAVEFLRWLMDNNFTFLGARAYDFKKGKNPQTAFKASGLKLGILTDASVRIIGDARVEEAPSEVLSFMESDDILIVTKANSRTMVHRPVWLDYIGIKLFDDKGKLTGELRIVGLFTSVAYTSSVLKVPFLKQKAKAVVERLGFNASDHSGKALINVLENYPRDEMFRADIDTLVENIRLILELGEVPRVRALAHADPFGRFVSVLVYVPRDRYDSSIREKIGTYLMEIYGGDLFEFQPLFLEGALTRVYYVVHRKGSEAAPQYSRQKLEGDIGALIRNWEDNIYLAAHDTKIPQEQIMLAVSFPESYRNGFGLENALQDAAHILSLDEANPLYVEFFHHRDDGAFSASLKLFHRGSALALSERVPLLENMGFRVIAEQTLEMPDGRGHNVYLHDMQIDNAYGQPVDLSDSGKRLAEAFEAIWAENAADDAFNALTQTAKLDWHEIVILRSYGRYLQQAGISYSQSRLAQALNSYPMIARDLYQLFQLKFDPAFKAKDNTRTENTIQNRIELELQNVPSLDDDVILRRFRNLIAASLRTNAYLRQADGSPCRILAIKFDPRQVDGLPEPRPYREIFVYGPEVEGVHLRFGPVARGGIRWSDRGADYRTEVLGLVKAQQVKNAVIVPVGSKGGFYPHKLPQSNDRALVGEAARQAYILYISAMLSITDNLVNGKVVPPKGIIRHDGDDPYFVVAADKGTATFSDTANAISQARDFWLDDAFASGGSAGYDHKEMGITAKGAWEAVKRHFRELMDRDIQKESFTCVGVGDMSGDVFGNGMLLSKQTKLIAAFDHRDIFIDPDPDTTKSYNERARLFKLPRSSWQDYDKTKLSKGGGVFSRSLKTITLSPEAARAIGFDKKSGTPFEIMTAILKAQVDLLWFGGIGTYIRSETETDAQVGDRANDAIRITGADVRARIIGEGANLGVTQRGRIEYAMKGGRCETDAIDNSAGVNCSDVEVNIKIALASAMRADRLTRKARDKLLKEMTPDVSKLVLRNNYLQPLTLSLAEKRGVLDLPYQIRFINDLERHKLLDRQVEILPSDQALRDRMAAGNGLTRPELAVIMAYAKLTLQDELTKSPLVDDAYFKTALFGYFPSAMQKKYADDIEGHQLRRDIIATLLANDVVNRGGPTFVNRLQDKTGAAQADVIRAYIAVRDGFDMISLFDEIDALDNKVSGNTQNRFYMAVMSMLFNTTGWILRNLDMAGGLAKAVEDIRQARQIIEKQLVKIVPVYLRNQMDEKARLYSTEGAPKALAARLATLEIATIIPDIALVAGQAKSDLVKTADIYFAIAEMFRINRIEDAGRSIPVVDYYDGMALAQANDTIAESLRAIVLKVIRTYGKEKDPVQAWMDKEGVIVENAITRMNALIEGDLNISRFSVAAGMMSGLARGE